MAATAITSVLVERAARKRAAHRSGAKCQPGENLLSLDLLSIVERFDQLIRGALDRLELLLPLLAHLGDEGEAILLRHILPTAAGSTFSRATFMAAASCTVSLYLVQAAS